MTEFFSSQGEGQNVQKQGGDAFAGSGAYSSARGGAFQEGAYSEYGSGSVEGGAMGAGSIADAGFAGARAGDGGVDQTAIGDININA